MPYLIYLRKSRADLEAEARGEGETLARHEETLLALANRKELDIGGIYREIVSGESIAARPQMQRLLEEVAAGQWEGVLVMEVERLARGNTLDQGIVSNAFTSSGTVIITPIKTYDPCNEFDQEYFEFSLFMSRREYKTIRRRMEAGRIAAVREGCFIGNVPPYGYEKYRRDDGKYSLKIVPDEAETVRYIYESRAAGNSITETANTLNDSCVPTRKGAKWQYATIRDMIENPVYKGSIRWNNRCRSRKQTGKSKELIIVRGLHEPIVSEELWERANSVTVKRSPSYRDRPLSNPLAGLIICGECGHSMIVRSYKGGERRLICMTRGCSCRGTTEEVLTRAVSAAMSQAFEGYYFTAGEDAAEHRRKKLAEELERAETYLARLEGKRQKLYELLETGVYAPEEYAARRDKLEGDIISAKKRISDIEAQSKQSCPTEKLYSPAEALELCNAPEAKNRLYKAAVRRILYYREQGNGKYSAPPIDISVEFLF
ncbi:MAG: recombinase family protein [Oscillospiraceae bacterium]